MRTRALLGFAALAVLVVSGCAPQTEMPSANRADRPRAAFARVVNFADVDVQGTLDAKELSPTAPNSSSAIVRERARTTELKVKTGPESVVTTPAELRPGEVSSFVVLGSAPDVRIVALQGEKNTPVGQSSGLQIANLSGSEAILEATQLTTPLKAGHESVSESAELPGGRFLGTVKVGNEKVAVDANLAEAGVYTLFVVRRAGKLETLLIQNNPRMNFEAVGAAGPAGQ